MPFLISLYTYCIIVVMHTVLPNHNLAYNISNSFCLEDPVAFELRLSMSCPLENTPVPPPNFRWTVMQNTNGHVTPMDLHSNQLQEEFLIINGSFLELRNDTDIVVTCTVHNAVGSDNSTTIIRLCSKLMCTISHTFQIPQQVTLNARME